jgi:uncharacterized protein (DUF58 family)
MTGLRRWLGWGSAETTQTAERMPDAALNPATWASVQDLIALQPCSDKIDLSRAYLARARLVGDHLSRFRGRGMDYQESRAYQAGDDVRDMDWRITARTGKPHVKLYREERERPVILFVDLGPGMFFGSRGTLKSVVAARACALIGWAAEARGDRIGAMLFDGGYCDLQPRGGRHGVLRLIRRLVDHTDPRIGVNVQRQAGELSAALRRLRRISRPGSLIVLVGDYYGFDDDCGNHLLRLRQHSDVVALRIVDPLEEAPPPAARYGVMAGGRSDILDTRSAAVRQTYQHYFSRHRQALAKIMRDRAIPLLRLSTGEDIVGALRVHFAADGASARAGRRAA